MVKRELFEYLVEDIFLECINNGYTHYGALGKVKYELQPMIDNTSDLELLNTVLKDKLNTEI